MFTCFSTLLRVYVNVSSSALRGSAYVCVCVSATIYKVSHQSPNKLQQIPSYFFHVGDISINSQPAAPLQSVFWVFPASPRVSEGRVLQPRPRLTDRRLSQPPGQTEAHLPKPQRQRRICMGSDPQTVTGVLPDLAQTQTA